MSWVTEAMLGNDKETESCIDTVSVPDDELNYLSDVDAQGKEETCQEKAWTIIVMIISSSTHSIETKHRDPCFPSDVALHIPQRSLPDYSTSRAFRSKREILTV